MTSLNQNRTNSKFSCNRGRTDGSNGGNSTKNQDWQQERQDRIASLMQQLEQLDAERQQLSREAPAAAARLDATWSQVLLALRRCQQLNQSNGRAVNQRLGQVRQALSVLTGHASETGLYGPTGGLRGSLRSQVLAQA